MTITLKQIEVAARRLCETRGANPDELVTDASAHFDHAGLCPQWMNAADEIRRHLQVEEAINFARQAPAGEVPIDTAP